MLESITPLLSDPAAWAALVTLVVMEVVLGIDNLIFISILTNKLPEHQRSKGRKIGIGLPLGCSIELGLAPGFLFGSPLLCRRRFGRATLRQKAFDPRSSCPAARQSEAGAAWRRRRC